MPLSSAAWLRCRTAPRSLLAAVLAPPRPSHSSYGQLLARGLLAGLIAGILAGAVAFTLGEAQVDAAIALEHTQPGAAGHHEDELVSRTGQKAGLFLATGLAGVALGALLASIFHLARRYTDRAAPALAALIAAGGWAAIEAVPFFKYPASPPGVGDAATIHDRTLLWLAAVLLGLAAVGTAAFVWTALHGPPAMRVAASAGAFLFVATIGYLVLPGINEVPADFPATLLWRFRVASLATQAALWLGLGLAFAVLTELAERRVAKPAVLEPAA